MSCPNLRGNVPRSEEAIKESIIMKRISLGFRRCVDDRSMSLEICDDRRHATSEKPAPEPSSEIRFANYR